MTSHIMGVVKHASRLREPGENTQYVMALMFDNMLVYMEGTVQSSAGSKDVAIDGGHKGNQRSGRGVSENTETKHTCTPTPTLPTGNHLN